MLRLPILSLAAVLLAAIPTAHKAAPLPDVVHDFLREQMGFSAGDVSTLEAGRPVARQMQNRDAVDVNIFGAVRIDAPADAFIRQLHDIDVFERKLGVLQAGRFHEPPILPDLAALTLEDADVEDLEHCRPTDCELQLPASAIARFRHDVNWQDASAKAMTDRLFRVVLFERLQAYRSGGLAALDYHDRGKPIAVADDFGRLSTPGDLPIELPELIAYLRRYPGAALPAATNVFYWNKGEFGMKPTVRLNHLVIYPMTGAAAARGLRYVVATSQIYADHYFSATLELRTIVDDPARPGRSFYLLYTTKSRVSGLTGFIGMLIRPMVRSRARSGMERYLGVTKRILERGRTSSDRVPDGTRWRARAVLPSSSETIRSKSSIGSVMSQ